MMDSEKRRTEETSRTKQILYVVDIQESFSPPDWLIKGAQKLADKFPSIATVERHNEDIVPFRGQLNWAPSINDKGLVNVDREFIKYGYTPPAAVMQYLNSLELERVLVCGMQTETCVLAAGFQLFDAGPQPTLVEDLTVGSSLDPTGKLGIELWKHHFGSTVDSSVG